MTGVDEQIFRIFREVLFIELPSASTDIIAAGLLDSLALVTLLFEIEQEFEVSMPLENLDIEGLRTVASIVQLVESLIVERDSQSPMGDRVNP